MVPSKKHIVKCGNTIQSRENACYIGCRKYRERRCADTIGTVPVPWVGHFLNIYFSNKLYGSNFIKQHSETVMVWNYQNSDCSLRKKYGVIYYNFRHPFLSYCFRNEQVNIFKKKSINEVSYIGSRSYIGSCGYAGVWNIHAHVAVPHTVASLRRRLREDLGYHTPPGKDRYRRDAEKWGHEWGRQWGRVRRVRRSQSVQDFLTGTNQRRGNDGLRHGVWTNDRQVGGVTWPQVTNHEKL